MKLFHTGWSFYKATKELSIQEIQNILDQFQPVEIPHDWLIYHTNDLYENSTGWYYKKFDRSELDCISSLPKQSMIPFENDEIYGEKGVAYRKTTGYEIIFDGVYMNCSLYCNGYHVGDWKYGYSAFSYDLTSSLKEKENEIVLQVRHQAPNSRWYSGAGIYRDVFIREYGENRFALDGLYFHTTKLDMGYQLEVEAEVIGENLTECECMFFLYQNQRMFKKLGAGKWKQGNGVGNRFELTTTVKDIREWDIENPVCYQIKAVLFSKNEMYWDLIEATVGFKHVEYDPFRGMKLNGRKIKLFGSCEHHDLGCLGSAFRIEAARKRLQLLKKMGVNAIRFTHNMPARQMMDLADEMGFLVISEAFDMWERSKTEFDYARFFKEWVNQDVRSWIRRDRNHPCLLMWSIGNEIYDTHADEHGVEITKRLIGLVKQYDPKGNAVVTIGSNYMPWEGARNCADLVKFAGYNYGVRYYDEHHEQHPDWIIYGSETASTVQSRGIYKFPLSQSVLSDQDEQCSCLGNSSTSWGAKNTEDCIISDRDKTYSLGQFIWTGFDYIGEPTPYHTKNSYFGQIDTAGFEKDTFYIYQAEWTNPKERPMVHIFPYWDFSDGEMIDIRICTNGAFAELFVNGVSYGQKSIDHRYGEHVVSNYQVPYQKGEIKAVAYDEEKNVIAVAVEESFEDAKKIVLSADESIVRADGEDFVRITIEALDQNGKKVKNATDYVQVKVTGGRLLGMDNGDSTDYDPYKGNVRKLFSGKCIAVVEPDGSSEKLTVHVKSNSLEEAEIMIPVDCNVERKRTRDYNLTECMELSLKDRQIPVRTIACHVSSKVLTKSNPVIQVEAVVKPVNATDQNVEFEVVTPKGIPCPFARITQNGKRAQIEAFGDGKFHLRCLSKSGTEKVRVITQMDLCAEGIGHAFLNPYEFISAGLHTNTYGRIGNGNDLGIATQNDGESGITISQIDFGEFGSDEITLPIFALSSEPYEFEIWLGKPREGELLLSGIYQKPVIWNVYQEETYRLKQRIRGVNDLSFIFHSKVHLKGFVFGRQKKAFSKLYAAECDSIYGDDFQKESEAVTGIGNNVTMMFDQMDFEEEKERKICMMSKSKLPVNTVHVRLKKEGELVKTVACDILGSPDYQKSWFSLGTLKGNMQIEFLFLPGTNIDFHWFQIE